MHMMSVSDIARARGVDKSYESRRIRKLELRTWPGPGRRKCVSVEEYKSKTGLTDADLVVPRDSLEVLRRDGSLSDAQVYVARLYQNLISRAGAGDVMADAIVHQIHRRLDVEDVELFRRVLVLGEPLDSHSPSAFTLSERLSDLVKEIGALGRRQRNGC
jgi:hypothetical protein